MVRPRIGITTDLDGEGRCGAADRYAAAVRAAGGLPLLLPCQPGCADEYLRLCDGLVLSGGDDPIMERWGVPTHPAARKVHPRRQAFELELLEALDAGPGRPVLGVCLGMQLMGLHRGGGLEQCLAERVATADLHWPRTDHEVRGTLGAGVVHSHHRQALVEPGRLDVAARSADGVIEAVRDPRHRFYVGVQWHPERTGDERLGRGLFRRLVRAASGGGPRPARCVGS